MSGATRDDTFGSGSGYGERRVDSATPAMASSTAALPELLAIALVTGSSAAVLILEILAGRMLAPYVGVNLETYTAIIGTILAGIALGAWAGGRAADRFDPHRLIPLLLVAGGALAIASIPVVRTIGGDPVAAGAGGASVLLALWGFGPAAAVLSAVPPAVVKLQLRDLELTGTTVGRLSAWGTAGAIGGTFLAGYVLVAFAAVTTLIVTVGAILAAGGLAFASAYRRGPALPLLSASGVAAVAVVGVVATTAPCDVQSAYYCISIDGDPDRPTGRVLVLDDLNHSYVDSGDPAHLEFWYVRRIADAIETLAPEGPIDVVSLGAGALTIPRWLDTTRPGSSQTVLEIDPDLIDVVAAEFGLPDAVIVVGDGRLSLRALPDDSADVVVGDAFGSRSVPWHLATREFMAEVDRVLRPGGIYVANVIDGGDEDFLRAEVATIRTEWPTVAVVRGPRLLDGSSGNAVVVAGAASIDVAAWEARRLGAGDGGALVDDLDDYLDGAAELTDDFAPVDQLIAGSG